MIAEKKILYIVISLFVFEPFLNYIFLNTVGISFTGLSQFFIFLFTVFLLFNRKNNLKIPVYIKFFSLYIICAIIINYFKIPDYYIPLKSLLKRNFFVLYFFIILENINLNINIAYVKKLIIYIKPVLLTALIVILYQMIVDPTFFVNPDYIEQWWKDSFGLTDIRLPSIYSWTTTMGPGLTFMPLLALVISFYFSKKSKWVWFWYIIGITFSFLTLSRWVMLNALILFLMIPMYRKIKLIQYSKVLVLSILFVSISIFLLKYVGVDTSSIISKRILEQTKSQGFENTSANTRILAFNYFIELFPESPVFGVGAQITDELEDILKGRSYYMLVIYLYFITTESLEALYIYFL